MMKGAKTIARSIACAAGNSPFRLLFRLHQQVRLRRDQKTMNAIDRAELLRLLARESYFERDLTLASGRASNFYIDCKRTLYLPRGAHLAGALMLELVMAEGIGQIGGMAAGALPVT